MQIAHKPSPQEIVILQGGRKYSKARKPTAASLSPFMTSTLVLIVLVEVHYTALQQSESRAPEIANELLPYSHGRMEYGEWRGKDGVGGCLIGRVSVVGHVA